MSLTGLAQDVQGQQGQQGQHTQRRDFSPEAFWKMLQEYVNHEAGLSQEEGEKIYPMLNLQRKHFGRRIWHCHQAAARNRSGEQTHRGDLLQEIP